MQACWLVYHMKLLFKPLSVMDPASNQDHTTQSRHGSTMSVYTVGFIAAVFCSILHKHLLFYHQIPSMPLASAALASLLIQPICLPDYGATLALNASARLLRAFSSIMLLKFLPLTRFVELVSRLTQKPKRKALLIGVEHVEGDKDDLRGPHRDVYAMKNLLISKLSSALSL